MFFILIYFKISSIKKGIYKKTNTLKCQYAHFTIQITKKYSNDIFLAIPPKIKKCFSIFIVIFRN